ncbi:MAG TPA: radical SAM protein [Bacillota bacterium]|jgi:DNA repair photolyase|nr:radical SAM protein [Bacillota bacterium]HOL09514.1 radical SAM protein [Bacillota bacterium]HPO98701.1 radical SAM protein [Bacillota bacterium]
MLIEEVTAKRILSPVKSPTTWFGVRWNINVYRGCQHKCIYCDSRSICYGLDSNKIVVKTNAVELLRQELAGKRSKAIIGTGSMCDPYGPVELQYNLSREVLKVIFEYGFGVHIITKSDLILRDIEILKSINANNRVSAAFTLTTVDDNLAAKLEPGAPLPSKRLAAIKRLTAAGICTGVTLMPVLPYITDSEANIGNILEQAYNCGAHFIIASFGMTLRDRQRDYYYQQLDRYFPGLRQQYQNRYQDAYHCPVYNYQKLAKLHQRFCEEHLLISRMSELTSGLVEVKPEQLSLFD